MTDINTLTLKKVSSNLVGHTIEIEKELIRLRVFNYEKELKIKNLEERLAFIESKLEVLPEYTTQNIPELDYTSQNQQTRNRNQPQQFNNQQFNSQQRMPQNNQDFSEALNKLRRQINN